MHKNPVSFCLILESVACSIKPLSNDIALIFKLFYERSGTISYKRKNFDFSMLCTKIPHDKLVYDLHEVTDFSFNVGTTDYMFIVQDHFGLCQKSKAERSFSFQEVKSCLEFVINSIYFQVDSSLLSGHRYSYYVRSCAIFCYDFFVLLWI